MARSIRTLRALQHTWTTVHQMQSNAVQVSDFMSDEEGVQELCRHVARWLFGKKASLLPTTDQDSDHTTSEEDSALSEDRIQVWRLPVHTQLQCHICQLICT